MLCEHVNRLENHERFSETSAKTTSVFNHTHSATSLTSSAKLRQTKIQSWLASTRNAQVFQYYQKLVHAEAQTCVLKVVPLRLW